MFGLQQLKSMDAMVSSEYVDQKFISERVCAELS